MTALDNSMTLPIRIYYEKLWIMFQRY